MMKQDEELIHYALIGLEEQKRQIDEKILELRGRSGPGPSADVPQKAPAARKGMSAAGRERIAAAQRARWAAQRGTAAQPVAAQPVKKSAAAPARKKGTMSAEARARIAEAQRKRWAAAKKKQ